jgi:hypothetical protein
MYDAVSDTYSQAYLLKVLGSSGSKEASVVYYTFWREHITQLTHYTVLYSTLFPST